MMLYYLYTDPLPVQVNTQGIAYAPASCGGRAGVRGLRDPSLVQYGIALTWNPSASKFPGNLDFRPEKFGRTNFRPEFFWIFQISNRKKLGRKTFSPNFFAIFNFRTKNFPVFKISRPKKVRVF
jgi:hypothetical protein